MPLLSTDQTADRIGVSVRHVQRLIADGQLIAIGPDRVDADSVAHWVALRHGSRGRAWEEPTAWAAVALLEGLRAPWLGQAQRSRLRTALSSAKNTEVAARTRNRALVHRFRAHPRGLGHLAREAIPSGATRGLGGLSAVTDRIDGYVDDATLSRLIRRFRLEPDPAGNVILRETAMPSSVVTDLAKGRRHVLAALDLAGSIDARERSTGLRLLDRALERLGD
jgi:hypothetical protein